MKQTYLKICILFVTLFMLFSCEKRKYDVDVDNIEVEMQINRYENELINLSKEQDIEPAFFDLYAKYPEMTEVFFTQILPCGYIKNPNFRKINGFVNDSNVQAIIADVQAEFKTTSSFDEKLTNAFKHYKYYYPNDTLPRVFSTITGFSVSAFTYTDLLVISLDRYLGADYIHYPSRLIPEYMKRRMDKEYIASQAMKALFAKKYPAELQTQENMLSQMIWMGKQLFWLDIMMPTLNDTLKIEYTTDQLKWVQNNEIKIFDHFIKNELFYSTDQKLTSKYLNEAPYTVASEIPIESAPRIGEWLGWVIVKKYMEENPDVSAQDLFNDLDYQKIFQKARYKP